VRSPRNVRKTGGESFEDLAASILAHGLLHNLTVIEHLSQKGAKSGKYEVIAGARRFAALQRLASEKKISKTFAVPCKVVEASDALELSLAENTIRVAMHPADQFIAFRDLVESGLSIDRVAARFGVTTLFVRQRLKLANVAPRFIEDYRAGALQLEQLEALAITDDHQAQERAWNSAQYDWDRSPHNLRRLLTEKQVSTSDKRAIFVGVEPYLAAGGTIERDLFDEQDEGYLTDPALLVRLVGDRCEKLIADLLAQGWAWVKPSVENPWELLQQYTRLQPVPVTLSEDLIQEADKLQAEPAARLLLRKHRGRRGHLGFSRGLESQVHDQRSRQPARVRPGADSSGGGPSAPCRPQAHRNLRVVRHKPRQHKLDRSSFRGWAGCLQSEPDVATDRRNHTRKESAR